jgi:hypothetical protein
MFDSALIRRIDGTEVDLGLIAETIFFYGKTHLLLDRSFLTGLVRELSLSDFQRLLDSDTVQFSYRTGLFGVISTGSPRSHKFVEFFVGPKDTRKARLSVPEEIDFVISQELGGSPDARALKRLITRNVTSHKSPRDLIPKLADADVSDKRYLISAVRTLINHLVPEYLVPANLEFSLHDTGSGYAVVTNLNYSEINGHYHKRIPASHSTISSEYLLSFLQDARADTYFAAHYLSEIVTTPTLSDLIRIKHFDFLMRQSQSAATQELFKEITIGDLPSIREVITSKERTFAEFLSLIEDGSKFRGWLRKQNPDANLIQEYQRTATADTWADKLPTKGVRFIIATGLGLLGEAFMPTGLSTAAGVSIGAGDTFLLDKILKGWRPNQFVETRLRSFLSPESE